MACFSCLPSTSVHLFNFRQERCSSVEINCKIKYFNSNIDWIDDENNPLHGSAIGEPSFLYGSAVAEPNFFKYCLANNLYGSAIAEPSFLYGSAVAEPIFSNTAEPITCMDRQLPSQVSFKDRQLPSQFFQILPSQ